jgi:hypothetical protein
MSRVGNKSTKLSTRTVERMLKGRKNSALANKRISHLKWAPEQNCKINHDFFVSIFPQILRRPCFN